MDVSESDNATAPQVPPLGCRGLEPDATAPDGSEIRLLLDERHHAQKASMVEVALAAGQVSRPVRHLQVEEVWYVLEGRGQVWRCPPDAGTASVPAVSVASGDALVIPVGWSFQFSVAHAPRFASSASPSRLGLERARRSQSQKAVSARPRFRGGGICLGLPLPCYTPAGCIRGSRVSRQSLSCGTVSCMARIA